MAQITNADIHKSVQDHYDRLAEKSLQLNVLDSCCGSDDGSCCSDNSLYEADLSSLPEDLVSFSLGCGDPITLAGLEPGNYVLDLGSGGGLDCFLAAEKVGSQGKVIGVDMTPPMIARANRNKERLGIENVEFHLGQIEAIPVESDSIDVIISNCVINLSPDKQAVFNEAYRVLKAGGRLAVSDILTQGRFTAEDRANMDAWSGCVSGAEEVSDYVAALKSAGFVNISIRDKAAPTVELSASILSSEPARPFSARITAEKPN
ncbi:MAG: arsenite methyltransferase [Candidatus Promineifilaceae bacterium]|jgi:SAM-dependent methyltransferase